jgi:hypothetical protein
MVLFNFIVTVNEFYAIAQANRQAEAGLNRLEATVDSRG